MKPTHPRKDPFADSDRLATLGEWLRFAEKLYDREQLALGQVATNAHDEALYLLLRTLDLPLESDARVLAKTLTAAQRAQVREMLRRRALDRTPAAYLTREAWLGEHRFYVDERVIIPRSYFLEIIPQLGESAQRPASAAGSPKPGRGGISGSGEPNLRRGTPGLAESALPLDPAKVTRVADVCTGSGCLAILLAHRFPKALVEAVDLSTQALDVAAMNIREHRLGGRVHLYQSDVFDSVPAASYDVILSNPPYEPSQHVDAQAPEFAAEPRMAHDGGADGLVIIRKLLHQSKTRLAPHGILVIEVGGLREAIDREFGALQPRWLPTHDGSDCVCVFQSARLKV